MNRLSDAGRHHMVGGGIAALSAAVFLVRDAGVPGDRITIFEDRSVPGGSLDGSGDAETGYLTRGGRMFEPNFVCTLDLLSSIPAPDDPAVSIRDDILAFNRMAPGRGSCRLVRGGRRAEDRFRLGLGMAEIVALARLLATPERRLAGRSIEDCFADAFFASNFWLMWSTMFSFRKWHSAAEMRRYMRRFLHLFPGLARIVGVLRTRYDQFDSMVAPICAWLRARGVELRTDVRIADVTIDGDADGRRVTALHASGGETVPVGPEDRVYLTLGSMTDATVTGRRGAPPPEQDGPSPAFDLWRRLAARHEGFGRPEVFAGRPERSCWTSFTVTLRSPAFLRFMEDFSGDRTGTGGLVTFADSSWLLSVVMFHQPHFRGQPAERPVFWGYGLHGERPGDAVPKPMARATGRELLEELSWQLRLEPARRDAFFEGAKVISCRMPYITSQFMPRRAGDRPPVIPRGAENFAVIGQFSEIPNDCVFTVEYSVRSAWSAVHGLTGRTSPPPPVVRVDRDPLVLLRAARTLLSG